MQSDRNGPRNLKHSSFLSNLELEMEMEMVPLEISKLPEPESETATLLPTHHSPKPESKPKLDPHSSECAYESCQKIIISNDTLPESDNPLPFSFKKLWLFMGPGFLMCIAFLDPGNLEGDLQAGAIAGYSLLWLLMWTTAMGLLIQLLSARLGVVTGKHLAEICREEYPKWARLALWLMAEVALIGADIQEVIGSAIAIKILSRDVLPLWAGVIITGLDCVIFLFLENYGVRKLETFFAVLIATMAVSFAWMFSETKPNKKDLLLGLAIPHLSSKNIRQAVGVVGCVITPHNVFLHSALVQSRKINTNKKNHVREALNYVAIESTVALIITFSINLCVTTVFAKGFYGTERAGSVGLENAGQFLEEEYGGGSFPILYLWGIGLLAAGQSSTITGTYAGQFIMGGFLNLRLKKWVRSVITRGFAIGPPIVIAIFSNTSNNTLDLLNEWLNLVQSLQIPFAIIPLVTLVSKEQLMGVFAIGHKTKVVSWTVASFLITVNAYLLLQFFAAEVQGLLSGLIVCVFIVVYVIFVLYLILRDGEFYERLCNAMRKSF